jgi:hypothetical protein
VSNNVHTLKEPWVRTGAHHVLHGGPLAFTAGGIILLYPLQAQPAQGQTLNAVVFGTIIDSLTCRRAQPDRTAGSADHQAGLLSSRPIPVSAGRKCCRTWLRPVLPHQFRHLSTRLVTQNGIGSWGWPRLCPA